MNFKLLLLLISSMLFLQSCGSGGDAGGSGNALVLTSSNIYANSLSPSIDSDISADLGSTTGIHKDTLDVNIVSTITAKAGITPLPVQVNSVTVSYQPRNGGPALPTLVYPLSISMAAGSTLKIPIDVVALNQKTDILFGGYIGSTMYYNVMLIFDISEVGFGGSSGKAITYTVINCDHFKDK